MSDIHIEKNHNFDFITARTKAKAWLEKAQNELGVQVNYQEGDERDTATVKRSGVEAVAVLTSDTITFDAKLGFLAKAFKGQIEDGIKTGLAKYFV